MHKISKLLLVITFVFSTFTAFSCTTILVGKELTIDGSVIHAHNEDMGFTAVGRLWHVDAKSYNKNEMLDVPYITIPQVKQSYAYWASGNATATTGLDISSDTKSYDSVLVGMNEWGVTMSCNWMNSKEINQEKIGIRRYAIRQLILERAKTAQEAVQIVGGFIEKYGQADWGGLDYILADTNEAWVVETTTNHWVARKVKDDEIWVVANRFTVGEDYDLSSKNLVDNAIKQGWYKPKTDGKFNFSKVYGKPENMHQAYDIAREERVKYLLNDKRGIISAENLFQVLSDRYEGTDEFTKPQAIENWREISEKNKIPRTISNNLGQSSSVAVLRSDMPIEVGAMMWYTMVSPQFSGYFPVYAGSSKIPQEMQNTDSKNNESSAWWVFKNIHNIGTQYFEKTSPIVNNFWTANHAQIVAKQNLLEKKLVKLFKSGNKQKGMDLLDTFTFSQAGLTLYHAKRLLDIVSKLE